MLKSGADRDIVHYLQQYKDGDWTSDRIGAVLSLDALSQLADQVATAAQPSKFTTKFQLLDPSIKLKVLFSFLTLRKKQLADYMEGGHIQTLLKLGVDNDEDDWVRIVSEIVNQILPSGQEQTNDGRRSRKQTELELKDPQFKEVQEAIMSAHSNLGDIKFFPLETRYLSHKLYRTQEQPTTHFQLKKDFAAPSLPKTDIRKMKSRDDLRPPEPVKLTPPPRPFRERSVETLNRSQNAPPSFSQSEGEAPTTPSGVNASFRASGGLKTSRGVVDLKKKSMVIDMNEAVALAQPQPKKPIVTKGVDDRERKRREKEEEKEKKIEERNRKQEEKEKKKLEKEEAKQQRMAAKMKKGEEKKIKGITTATDMNELKRRLEAGEDIDPSDPSLYNSVDEPPSKRLNTGQAPGFPTAAVPGYSVKSSATSPIKPIVIQPGSLAVPAGGIKAIRRQPVVGVNSAGLAVKTSSPFPSPVANVNAAASPVTSVNNFPGTAPVGNFLLGNPLGTSNINLGVGNVGQMNRPGAVVQPNVGGVRPQAAGTPVYHFNPVKTSTPPPQAPPTTHPPRPTLTPPPKQPSTLNDLFEDSTNMLTAENRHLIQSFLSGNRQNPDPLSGPIRQIVIHFERKQEPESGQMVAEHIVFEMNYEAGTWKKLRRKKREGVGAVGLPQGFPQAKRTDVGK
ncbi:hypothetical protein PROFUN_06837 [Planoprotostelium fungivorum]|uniref:Negative elongation factor A n=1 Tax=Planoprotostelium fungivorum TaxID=1890364 RepID=A0A2P6NNI8_9EUKA|nr:hypothetical protein PROFUN_06837 [Planoprotostelium fungivorum]